MQHPLLHPRKNLLYYSIVWILVIGIHTIVLLYLFRFSFAESLEDACISYITFALLALSFWYTVRFISIDSERPLLVIFNHLMAAVLFLAFWQLSTYFLMRNIIASDKYLLFLDSSVPIRLLIGLFLYCIIILSFYLYKYYFSFRMRIIRESESNMIVKEGELALLKSQLQPHFIFNSLNSVYALMITDPERAREMIQNLASFLRLTMNKDQKKMIPLSEELENSSLYSNIEKIRFGDRLILHSDIEEQTLSLLVPNQILQPIIENAIKHGLYQFTGEVTILIEAVIKDQKLHLSVQNNHDPEKRNQRGYGIGLNYVRRRLFLLYGRKDLVHITDEKGIFNIELIIPYKQ